MPTITRISTTRRPVAGPDDVADDALFRQYRETGDRRLRNELIGRHRWLAIHCAKRFANKGEPLDDLIQVAMLGVLKAVERFDPDYGATFATFAVPPSSASCAATSATRPGRSTCPAGPRTCSTRSRWPWTSWARCSAARRPSPRSPSQAGVPRRGRARRPRGRPLLPQDPARHRLRRRHRRVVDLGPSARTSGGSTPSTPPPRSSLLAHRPAARRAPHRRAALRARPHPVPHRRARRRQPGPGVPPPAVEPGRHHATRSPTSTRPPRSCGVCAVSTCQLIAFDDCGRPRAARHHPARVARDRRHPPCPGACRCRSSFSPSDDPGEHARDGRRCSTGGPPPRRARPRRGCRPRDRRVPLRVHPGRRAARARRADLSGDPSLSGTGLRRRPVPLAEVVIG